jgi:hypothetical protein
VKQCGCQIGKTWEMTETVSPSLTSK